MITQGIKRWLHSLFAWWPWKYSSETDYAQTRGTVNKGTAQETLFRTTVDGFTTQPGITSVAVEPIEGETISETNWSTTEGRPEHLTSFTHITPSTTPSAEESGNPPLPTPEETAKTKTGNSQVSRETPAPTTEQRLEFLRYLVKRGIVSENIREERAAE